MNWKHRTAIRILLLVAQMFADEEWKEEIGHLANHINQARELLAEGEVLSPERTLKAAG